jgi:hypothetical protein
MRILKWALFIVSLLPMIFITGCICDKKKSQKPYKIGEPASVQTVKPGQGTDSTDWN